MRIHLIHGLHTRDPHKTIGTWRSQLESMGFDVTVHNYGFLPFGFAWFRNPRIAKKIANKIKAEDVVIGYSNGAAIAYLIGKRRRYKGVVLLNGALDRDKVVPNVDFQLNCFTPGDDILKFAWLPWHLWGRIGVKGYSGKDPRNTDLDMSKYPPAVRGHSDLFKRRFIAPWAFRIGRRIIELTE